MNTRQIRQISVLAPLQRDTAQIIPNSVILGGLKEKIDVVGRELSKHITIERTSEAIRLYDNVLRFTCTDTGKVSLSLQDGSVLGEFDATSKEVQITSIQGITIKLASGLAGVTQGDITDLYIYGDSTHIIPGTILGRIKDEGSEWFGKFEPIKTDLSKYDVLRVCGGVIETDKSRLIASASNVMNADDKYTVDVYVFAEVIEEVCREINLTDEAKAKIQGIVWR